MMVPDYFEPIIGYRIFEVHKETGLLSAVSVGVIWTPYKAIEAVCGQDAWVAGGHHVSGGTYTPAPVRDCKCGIYALKTLEDTRAEMMNYIDYYSGYHFGWRNDNSVRHQRGSIQEGYVYGTVKLWGRVIEHETGYRAQFAYPDRLISPSPEIAARVSALYGVPCGVRAWTIDDYNRIQDERIVYPGILKSYFTYKPPHRLGVITSITGDAEENPAIIKPTPQPTGIVAPPHIVGANRWQLKQYAGVTIPTVQTVDYRKILRGMIYR